MPTLDVTHILTDPELADTFVVIRRAEHVDALGRAQSVETSATVVGVVTASSPSDLDRQEDYQTYSRSITVVCRYPLRGVTAGGQPDHILWRGSRYLVKHVDLYPHFGPGFYQAEASSIAHTDPALPGDVAAGAAQFNQAVSSAYAGVLSCF